ncbi:GRAM domain-containing protein 1B-like isoform X3 [Mizuhopecten yessoensis]|nr:GRAM domain-containing protein 1B-like isoform X3 [Mizuhopecten yessoensis]
MNCDSPGRNISTVYRRAISPLFKDVDNKSAPTCPSDGYLDNAVTPDQNKTSNSLDHNVSSDSASKSTESKKSLSHVETPSENIFGDKTPSSKVTPKVTVSSASSPNMCNDKLSVAKSDIDRSSSFKGLERASDSGSRSSAEFTRAHSRERSFEKSLDNIMDRCSEKSLDLNLSVECKNGTHSDKTSVDDSNVSKKSDKKKKTAPWYTQMWSPSYKSRTDDFKKFFKDVPSDDRLIVDYSCALQKDILVHGRMFLTQNWVCFYANIFRWETVLTIPCKEITAVTKEKTARVIPNAIQIATDKEKHFFTSFGARDKTYMMLFRVWQNALLEQPMSPKELWQWVHYSYGEELGLTSSDDDYVAPPAGIEEAVEENSKCENTDSSEVVPVGDIVDEDIGEGKPPEVLDFTKMDKSPNMASLDLPTDQSDTTDESEGEVVCTSDHNHFCKQMLFSVYHIQVEKLFDLLYNDTPFIQSVHQSKRNSNLAVSPWQDDTNGSGNRHRTLSYTVALNYSIGPKSSHTFEKQTLYKLSKPGSLYVVDTECSMAGIPYADAFVVVNRFCISHVTRHKSRLRITTEIRYKKSVWGLAKSMIEKNGYQGSEDFFKTLDTHLKREVDSLQETTKGSQTQSLKRKLRKRRTRTNTANMENATLKPSKPGMSRHLSLMENKSKQSRHTPQAVPPSPIRSVSQNREEKLMKLNADTLVRIILVVLVLLVVFNAILFYKLWSLEGFATMLYSPNASPNVDQTTPKSQDEWVGVLKQQQYLYEREIDKWKEILSSSITLIDQMKLTLVELRNSLESRLSTKDMYKMHDT